MNNKLLLKENGIGLVEVLFSAGLLAIVAVGITSNVVTSFRNHKRVLIHEGIINLASDKLEQYSAINPQTMTSTSHDTTEAGLTLSYISGMNFTRITDVTENADTSRTVAVTVQSNHATYALSKTVTSTFTRW